MVSAAIVVPGVARAETWRGIEIAPEHRCSDYDRYRDYRYPRSIENEIVLGLGAVYGPLHRDVLPLRAGNRHRAHRRNERGA